MMAEAVSWQPTWLDQPPYSLGMTACRMVETQHIAATMRLVDTAAEQALLEDMLDASKPPLPPEAAGCHYLLAAPFRYLPKTASRFRPVGSPGIWYGADDEFGSCAEIAYWRHRFLLDSAGLAMKGVKTEHSMYSATVAGPAIDLLAPPWNTCEALWKQPQDYTFTQQLAGAVREHGQLVWIRYGSVRAPGHVCSAVFDPRALTMVTPEHQYKQWHCHATKDRVTFMSLHTRYDFDF